METGSRALRSRAFTALEVLLVLCVVLAMLLPYSPANQVFPSRDSGVFLYTGWRILNGEIPYHDVWDHKPPVIFYLDALGLSLGGTWGVWSLEVISLGIAAGIGYFLYKRMFGLFTATLILFLWLFSLYYVIAGGNLTTEYTLPLQFALLLLFYDAESRQRFGWRGFLIGALTGLAFFTRQNAIGISLAIGLYLIATRFWARQPRRLLAELGPILAGGLMVTVFVVGYFALKGALADFWDSAFVYNFVYISDRSIHDRFQALIAGLIQLQRVGLTQLAFLGWGATLILLLFNKGRFDSAARSLLWMMVIALPLELMLVSIGGRARTPYFLALLPVFSIFAGIIFYLVFDQLAQASEAQPGWPAAAGAALTILTVLVLGLIFQGDYAKIVQNYASSKESLPMVAYIQKNSGPNDTVLMWGAETADNFVARRKSPTRFVYQYPLIKAGYSDEAKMTEFFGDILSNKPRLIIVTTNIGRIAGSAFGYSSPNTARLIDRIKDRYDIKEKIDSWVVYEYNGK
jgi:hypothetical protein